MIPNFEVEHPFTCWFDVHQGIRVLTCSQIDAHWKNTSSQNQENLRTYTKTSATSGRSH
jgi:hypothetical protein